MAALSIDATLVLASTGKTGGVAKAGAAITAGQVGYIADGNIFQLADANGTPPLNVPTCVALNGGSTNQPISYATEDPTFTPGFTVLAGDTIWLSPTAGGMTKTIGDLVAGCTVSVLGVMKTTTTMKLKIVTGGAVA